MTSMSIGGEIYCDTCWATKADEDEPCSCALEAKKTCGDCMSHCPSCYPERYSRWLAAMETLARIMRPFRERVVLLQYGCLSCKECKKDYVADNYIPPCAACHPQFICDWKMQMKEDLEYLSHAYCRSY